LEVSRELKESLPDLRVIYMSGYSDRFGDEDLLAEGDVFLQKPFKIAILCDKIRDLLKRR
jgi:hypothetical protein